MKINAETVQRLAELARLRLEGDEVERMQRDLESILNYVDKLAELDTTDVPPTTHVLDMRTPMREDSVEGVLTVEEAVRNAPEHDTASMLVPKVLE